MNNQPNLQKTVKRLHHMEIKTCNMVICLILANHYMKTADALQSEQGV